MLQLMEAVGHHLPMTPPPSTPVCTVGTGNVPDQVEGVSKGREEAESQLTEKPKRGTSECRHVVETLIPS